MGLYLFSALILWEKISRVEAAMISSVYFLGYIHVCSDFCYTEVKLKRWVEYLGDNDVIG